MEELSNDEKEKRSPGVSADCRTEISFFYQNFCPKKEVLNYGTSLTIEMELDMELLKKAIYQAYDRCEAMRLRFAQDKQGTWYQYVADKEERDIEYVDFSNGTMEEAEKTMTAWTAVPFKPQDLP